ncbi:MAG: S-layer homology domain-containing protein, partial [Acidobacteriota bacterium]
MKPSHRGHFFLILPVLVCALLAGGAFKIVQDQCGPFTDVTPAFCPYILELYYLGITAGTSATTYSPDDPLTRGQAAVFVSKGLNQSLARSSRRAALGQWWTTTPHDDLGLGVTSVPGFSTEVACDGADVWVSSLLGTISRIRGSDGKLLDSWTGATNARQILVAMGRVFAIDSDLGDPGVLYLIDPSQPSGPVTVAASGFGSTLTGLAFDGSRLWASHQMGVSIITPGPTFPWSVTTTAVGPDGLSFHGRGGGYAV